MNIYYIIFMIVIICLYKILNKDIGGLANVLLLVLDFWLSFILMLI